MIHLPLKIVFFSVIKQLKIRNTWKQNVYHQDKMLHLKPRIRDHLMYQPSLHVACGKNTLTFASWIPGKKQQEYTLASAIKNGSMESDFWTFVHPSWAGIRAHSGFPLQIVNIKISQQEDTLEDKSFHQSQSNAGLGVKPLEQGLFLPRAF